MTHKQIHLGQQLRQTSNDKVGGKYVNIEGELSIKLKTTTRWRISLSA